MGMFEQEDLKPSTEYNKYQKQLEKEAKGILATFKEHNSDTVEANLILKENFGLYKEKSKAYPVLKRIDYIIKEITTVFPKADRAVLVRFLEKNGFISTRIIKSAHIAYVATAALLSFLFLESFTNIGLMIVINFFIAITSYVSLYMDTDE